MSCDLTSAICVFLCCIYPGCLEQKCTHLFLYRIFSNVFLQSFIAPPLHWGVSHRSIELPYLYSQTWNDCSHGPLLQRSVYSLPNLSISIGCLLWSLSSGPLRRWVLVDSKVRGPTRLQGSHDFCGFLQIRAVFIELCWSTLNKTHSNSHIHY